MAVRLLAQEVSDICIGKPALRSLPVFATVGEAAAALRRSGESFLSVWSCGHAFGTIAKSTQHFESCRCVGKVCMVDVVCFLCKDENLSSPSIALQSPVSVLLPKVSGLVRHLEPSASVLDAIDLILEGAQHLVVPIQSPAGLINSRQKLVNKPSSYCSYCWLTQEDVIRFLLNSIGSFSPTPAFSIQSLDIIENHEILAVHYDVPALLALPVIGRALREQTSVAVVDEDGKLIGEISPLALACCDKSLAAAITTLSAGNLIAYIDCGNPPEDLVQMVRARLEESKLGALLELMEEDSFSSVSSSSDEEFEAVKRANPGRHSGRMMRRSEAIACCPESSLVAVMIQALAHRVNYVWVIEEDYSLAGMVTFFGMLKVFREHCRSRA